MGSCETPIWTLGLTIIKHEFLNNPQYCKPFSIRRTSLTTKYIIVTDWSGSPNKAEMNNLNSGALLSSKYRPWLEQK